MEDRWAGWWDWLVAVDLARCLVPTGHALIGDRGEIEPQASHRPWARTSSGRPGESQPGSVPFGEEGLRTVYILPGV